MNREERRKGVKPVAGQPTVNPTFPPRGIAIKGYVGEARRQRPTGETSRSNEHYHKQKFPKQKYE